VYSQLSAALSVSCQSYKMIGHSFEIHGSALTVWQSLMAAFQSKKRKKRTTG
jgi:hypothetical protein